MFLCALVGPLFPPPPAPCIIYVSFLCVRLFCCFFFISVFVLSAAPARPACAPCSSPCYPCPAALRPLTRLSPLPFSLSLSTLPVHLPSLSEPRSHSCVPPACCTLPLPVAPTLFSGVSPTLVRPRSPSLTPSWSPCALLWGGGVYLPTGLWPCPRTGMAVGFLRTMSHCMCRRNTKRTSVRRLSDSLRCICTVVPSCIDQLRTRAPIRTRRGHQGFTLRCTSQVSHGAGGHQGLAWSTPQSTARVSPMVSMQHHLVMQRALPPCNKSADSPHTPAASPQGRHRDVAPLHRTRVHLHCHLPIPAISPIAPSAKTLAPTCQNIGFVCPFTSPASQSPGTVLHPKGTALLHAISGRSRR